MPFNNGTFERVHNWVEDKENNIDINAVRLDQEDDNFADGLSQTLLRDGSVALTGNLDLGNHKIANLTNGTAGTDAVNKNQLDTKQNTITGAASTVTTANLSPNKVLISNSSGKITNDTRSVDDIINAAADSNKVVHIAGTETITGSKTFLGNLVKQLNTLDYNGIRVQNTLLTKGTAPATNVGGQFTFQDKDGYSISDRIGGLEVVYGTNGTIVTRMHACEPVANSSSYASIDVSYPASGNPYTTCPTPTDTTTPSGTQIATTGWVNTTGNNVVHLTNNETITGEKVFTGNLKENTNIIFEDNITKGTQPSSDCFINQYMTGNSRKGTDKDALGCFRTKLSSNNLVTSVVRSFKNIANSNANISLQTVYDTNNNAFWAEITPNNTGNDTNDSMNKVTDLTNDKTIPTMGWVNNYTKSTNVVHRAGSEVITGHKRFTEYILISTDTVERGKTMPSGNNNTTGIGIRDKNIKLLASFLGGASQDTNGVGYTYSYMRVFNPSNDSDTDATYLRLYYKANGDKYATCPPPVEDTNNSIQIDTVGARNTKLANYVALTGSQTISGTKTFSTSPIVPTLGNTDSSTKAATTAYVHNILEALYPVGSLYITTNNSATCPLASLISGSKWSLVAADKALWTSNRNGNTTINAGLPNITGAFNQQCLMNRTDTYARGALYQGTVDNEQRPQNAGGTDSGNNLTIAFDASKSNSIYGKSSTVQPPAYRVNVWRRTA